MNAELLRTELDRAEEAELQSDEQLRKLLELVDKASAASPTVNAGDCAKTVATALALNERLRQRADKLRAEKLRATTRAAQEARAARSN